MRPAVIGAVLLLVVACASAAGPTGSSSISSPVEQRNTNQMLRIAKQSLPPAASPEATNISNDFFNGIYDPLLRFGSNGELIPAVAEKWNLNNHNWRFTIRQDMTFSDGTKLTADDVVFSVNLIVEKNTAVRSYVSLITNARKIDERTVEIVTKQVDALLPNSAPWIYILPKAYYERVGTSEFDQKPIGSGPYQMESFNAQREAVMKLRTTPHPYRKPVATELRFVVVPDVQQIATGMRTGDLDMSLSVFTADQVDQFKANNIQVATRVTSIASALFSQPEAKDRNSPLQDKRVRQALNYAIDKEAMIDALFKGLATPASQLPLISSASYNPNIKPYAFDPAKAKALLAEAGYPNGIKLPKGIGFSPQTNPPAIAQIVQQNLKDVGVDAPINSYEFAVFLDQYYGRGTAQKDDLFLVTGGDPTGTFSLIRGQYACDKEGFATWFCSQGFVTKYDQAISETNAHRRTDLLRQATADLMEDVPVLLLYYRDGTNAMAGNLRGFSWPTPVWFEYDTVYRVG